MVIISSPRCVLCLLRNDSEDCDGVLRGNPDCDGVLRSNHNDDVADEHIVHRGTCLNLPEADPRDPKSELQTGPYQLLEYQTCKDWRRLSLIN